MIRPETIGYTHAITATEDEDRDGVARLVEDALGRGGTTEERDLASAVRAGLGRFAARDLAA